jgi:hypothetical protein
MYSTNIRLLASSVANNASKGFRLLYAQCVKFPLDCDNLQKAAYVSVTTY